MILQGLKILQKEGLLIFIQKSIRYLMYKIQKELFFKLFKIYFSPSDDLPKILEVSPSHVTHMSTIGSRRFPTNNKRAKKHGSPCNGAIVGTIGGPWDKYKKDWFENKLVYSLRNKYEKNLEWSETEYYQHRKNEDFDTREYSLNERVRDLDRLYNSMREQGYILQSDLINTGSRLSHTEPRTFEIQGEIFPDECRVGIGRNGELIRFNSGKHRITLAKILDLDTVPVIVVVRHSHWQKIRNIFKSAESMNDIPEKYRKHIGHPDINDI